VLPPVTGLHGVSASCGARAVRDGRRSRATGSSRRAQLPGPRRGPDDHAEPAAADIPAAGADIDSGELIAAQLPQVLHGHDASHRSHMGPCSRQPPRSNQDLLPGQHAHHYSMSTDGAR